MKRPSKNSKRPFNRCAVKLIALKRNSPVSVETVTSDRRTTSDLGLFERANDHRARDAVGEEVKTQLRRRGPFWQVQSLNVESRDRDEVTMWPVSARGGRPDVTPHTRVVGELHRALW